MQVVSQEVSAHVAAMPIVNAEEGAMRPFLVTVGLLLWFVDVQDNCNTIFVVISVHS